MDSLHPSFSACRLGIRQSTPPQTLALAPILRRLAERALSLEQEDEGVAEAHRGALGDGASPGGAGSQRPRRRGSDRHPDPISVSISITGGTSGNTIRASLSTRSEWKASTPPGRSLSR